VEPLTYHYHGKRRSPAALIGRIKEIAVTRGREMGLGLENDNEARLHSGIGHKPPASPAGRSKDA
jgi:hypothetical protein